MQTFLNFKHTAIAPLAWLTLSYGLVEGVGPSFKDIAKKYSGNAAWLANGMK